MKVELQPMYVVVTAFVLGSMQVIKNPNVLPWLTVYSKKGRAWTVIALSFAGTFALGIALGIRVWLELGALSVIMALLTVGLYEWLRAAGTKPEAPTREDDPRRP
jgi:hypothetical protein